MENLVHICWHLTQWGSDDAMAIKIVVLIHPHTGPRDRTLHWGSYPESGSDPVPGIRPRTWDQTPPSGSPSGMFLTPPWRSILWCGHWGGGYEATRGICHFWINWHRSNYTCIKTAQTAVHRPQSELQTIIVTITPLRNVLSFFVDPLCILKWGQFWSALYTLQY